MSRKRRKIRPVLSRPTLLAGALLAAALGVVLWRQVLSSRGTARDVPIALVPAMDQTDVDPAVLRLISGARTAVAEAPRSAEAWGRLGKVLLAHEFSNEARACFAQAEALDPGEPRWPYHQGTILSQGEPDAAIPKLQRAVEGCGNDPDAPRLRLAEILLAQGRPGDAEDQWQRLLRRDPAHARAHLGLARLAYQRGNLEQSMAHLNFAVNGSRTRKAAHFLLAEVYERRGDKAAAEQESRRAAALPDDEGWPDRFDEEVKQLQTGRQVFLARADRLMREGRVAEAIALLQQTVKDYPDSSSGWLLLGTAFLAKHDLGGAEEALRKASRLAPDSVEIPFYLGNVRFLRGDHREAAAYFRQAVQLKPDFALAYYNLGHCLMRLGDRDGAIGAFRAAVTFKPDYADAHLNLGDLLLQTGQGAEALAHLRDAAQLDPRDPRAKKLLEQLLPSVPIPAGP
jgi:tetratricopeptide (TPR) repeat protein